MPFKAPLREASNDRSCASFRTAANLTKHFCSIDCRQIAGSGFPGKAAAAIATLPVPAPAPFSLARHQRGANPSPKCQGAQPPHCSWLEPPADFRASQHRKDHGMQRFPPGLFFQQLLLLLKSLPLLGGLLKHKSAQAPRHAAPAFAPWWPSPATHMLSLPYGQATSLRRMTSPVPMPNIQPHARPA